MSCPSMKQGFKTRTKARRVLMSKMTAQSRACRVYLCPDCGEWHLTKSRSRNRPTKARAA